MRIAVLCLLSFTAAADAAPVFTWTDSQGVAHYTDRPIAPAGASRVPGVDAGLPQAPAAVPPPVLGSEALQGLWCEYELATPMSPGEPLAERNEWKFSGGTLEFMDLSTGMGIRSQFRVEGKTIVTSEAMMGDHVVRSFGADEMELGGDGGRYRLRRGGC